MTRINVIRPQDLLDQHLLAEHRELPRIFPLAVQDAARKVFTRATPPPTRYTLGKGHVTFFYNKLPWLARRHAALTGECVARGFQVRTDALIVPDSPAVEWEPDAADLEVNLKRLREKLQAPPRPDFYRHGGVVVAPTWYDPPPRT